MTNNGQDHHGLFCVCPDPACWQSAEVTRTWNFMAYAARGAEPMLHAKVSCPSGHHFTMAYDDLTILPDESELYGLLYREET